MDINTIRMNKYYDPEAWKNLKVHHNFIIRAENEPYAIFGVKF